MQVHATLKTATLKLEIKCLYKQRYSNELYGNFLYSHEEEYISMLKKFIKVKTRHFALDFMYVE